MFNATKIETEVLRILNKQETLKKAPAELDEEKILEEICKMKEKDSAVTAQTIKNALEGCIAKGFVILTGDGIKITNEGKKQI